ncbi:MAG: PglZ domain-containing protein [Caldilineaceae bacterium]
MSIRQFIQQQVFLPRLQQTGVLVVYDPDKRYRELCLELACNERAVVDAGESSIESRAAALASLQALGRAKDSLKELLVYVPAPPPLTDEDRQRDPFAIYGACGTVFPTGDGDTYQSLCLRARPDQATAIYRIFAGNPNPTFAMIDAIGGGTGWPQLQALLRVESAHDLLFALLAPTPQQEQALKGQEGWAAEARSLLEETLGLRLVTHAKTLGPIATELWRFLLFSEFVYDLPVPVPESLGNVAKARPEACTVVDGLCDRLRNDLRTQATYIARAEEIEHELGLPGHCREIADLGRRDTFPFEERTFYAQAVAALQAERTDQLRQLQQRHTRSVWRGRGENEAQWNLLEAAAGLVERCEDVAELLPTPGSDLGAWLDFYTSTLRDVDRLHREFEQAAGDYLSLDDQMAAVIRQGRAAYQKLANRVQEPFVRQVEKSGWPPTGRLLNGSVFDKLVAPKLQEGGVRTAYFMVDALRYELGVELQKLLAAAGQVDLQMSLAQLPTVTPVGMASLLPGAAEDLALVCSGDKLAVTLGGQLLNTPDQRMEVLRRRYGQRFAEAPLKVFLQGTVTIAPEVDLLVLRSNEMDSAFENDPDTAPGLIQHTFQRIRAALQKLAALKFHHAVIATDHGFYMNTAGVGSGAAGSVCSKPPGTWLTVHDRLLLGDGSGDPANFVLPADRLAIRGDFGQAGGPRTLSAYKAGQGYFHGGLSLPETVLPVLSVALRTAAAPAAQRPKVTLDYKQGARRITTRLPVVEVAVEGDLFTGDTSVEILLEAHDKAGTVVGRAKSGGLVNPATGTLSLGAGESVKITLKLDPDYEGKFTLKALDPVTQTQYSKLDLETDYTV